MYDDKKLYTFKDASFYSDFIKRAETVEKKRFVNLYNHCNNTHYHYDYLLKLFGEEGWKSAYINLLEGIEPDVDIGLEGLADEMMDFLEELYTEIVNKKTAIDWAAALLEQTLSNNEKIKLQKQINREVAFHQGLENEAKQATKRFKQLKTISPKVSFKESQGDWRMELKGDYYWRFPGGMEHWHEVKTDLTHFHITQSKDLMVLEPLIKNSKIVDEKGKLKVILTQEGLDQECQKLLTRKYKGPGTYPIYEDGSTTILSSELFKAFATDGINLYQSPDKEIWLEELEYKTYPEEDRDKLEEAVKKTFKKHQIKADLWYGR